MYKANFIYISQYISWFKLLIDNLMPKYFPPALFRYN